MDSTGHATFTVPVLNTGSGGYNYFDLYNVSTWEYQEVAVTSTGSSCTFVAPVTTVTAITGATSYTGLQMEIFTT